jgi:hypothetical protein
MKIAKAAGRGLWWSCRCGHSSLLGSHHHGYTGYIMHGVRTFPTTFDKEAIYQLGINGRMGWFRW